MSEPPANEDATEATADVAGGASEAPSGDAPGDVTDSVSGDDDGTPMATAVARGGVWNSVAMAVTEGAVFVQGFLLPVFLAPEVYGKFGIAAGFAFLGAMLRDFSLGMKVVQDQDRSVEDAFGSALSLELLLGTFGAILMLIVGPIVGYWKQDVEIALLIMAFAPFMYLGAVSLPEWVYVKRFQFRRRALARIAQQAAGTFAMFYAAIVLDWGVWALIVGMPVNFVMLIVTLWPKKGFRARLRWDRPTAREYFSFGWPIWAASSCIALFYLAAINAVEILFGFAFAGYFQRMWRFVELSYRLNLRAALAIYPAIVRMGTNLARMRASFKVTNRLMMVLSAPMAVILALFAPSLILFWSSEWADGAALFQAVGTFFIFGTLAFDWDLYYRAKGNTQPMFVVAAWLLAFLPLFLGFILFFDAVLGQGEMGVYVSVVVAGIYIYAIRSFYARRLLGNVSALRSSWRQILGAIVAGLVGFAVSEALGGNQYTALVGLAVMAVVYVGVIAMVERKLVVFFANALRGRPTGGLASLIAGDDGEDEDGSDDIDVTAPSGVGGHETAPQQA